MGKVWQMRNSRAGTTLDLYQQFVPVSQRRVVGRLTNLAQQEIFRWVLFAIVRKRIRVENA